jgi:hypothetical protein
MSKPANVGDHLEQLRAPLSRSAGTTPSERYLAALADRAFLKLWSYPNPYRAQKLLGGSAGKELCDLLVVCDPHVIVFSEKDISWTNKPTDVAWPRWFRKAVLAAADQLKGSERWINEFPDRIFLDSACTTPFPLNFPPLEHRRIHRVVVARGAVDACRAHFMGGLGTLVVCPAIQGATHCTPGSDGYMPFAIGDIDPQSDFVHVFDEVALDIIMQELDTISDFTEYLDKRSEFLRSGRLMSAHGEEDLLAYYAIRINDAGQHDFTAPAGKTWEDIDGLTLGAGHYSDFVNDPQYVAKKKADKISYAWDGLIETFTDHMIGGTSIVLPGHMYSLTNSELAVRYMALVNRFVRRSHSEAVLGALEIGQNQDVFFRAMLPGPSNSDPDTGFFFLTLKYLDWMEEKGGYEQYRLMRTFYLRTYAQATLMKYSHLKRVIGIAMEPPNQGRGASEDCIYAEQADWSDEDREQNKNDCDALRIMGPMQERQWSGQEYPDVPVAKQKMRHATNGNRAERRARAADERRRKRRKP